MHSWARHPKPTVEISVCSPEDIYTTHDRIQGSVAITCPVDTPYDGVEIGFVGSSTTHVEFWTSRSAAASSQTADCQFLRLSQPGTDHYSPYDRILRAAVHYTFPFVFVVPQKLLPGVCKHKVCSEVVRQAHSRLPPTMGERQNPKDMAPDMATVHYGIHVGIWRSISDREGTQRIVLASGLRSVRVIPTIDIQPPLNVHTDDVEYLLRAKKAVRKRLLTGQAGTLVMEAAQPQPLEAPFSQHPTSLPNTFATIRLRYDPLDESPPPRLGALSSEIETNTFFASIASEAIPTKRSGSKDLAQRVYSESFNLSSRSLDNIRWTEHEAAHDDEGEPGDVPEPCEDYCGGRYYVALLCVPVVLPKNRTFLPTFHSCLISRTYTLRLGLSVPATGIGRSLSLRVPLQISTAGMRGDGEGRHADTAANGERDETDTTADNHSIDIDMGWVTSTFVPEAQEGGGRSRAYTLMASELQVAPDDVLPPYSQVVSSMSVTTA